MKVLFTPHAWDDYVWWQRSEPGTLERLNALIKDATRRPFKGIGKPEPLKGGLAGLWSRRITLEHRLVYRVVGTGDDQRLEILQCRYHY